MGSNRFTGSMRDLVSRGDGALVTSVLQQAGLLVSGVGSAWLVGDVGRGQLAYAVAMGTVAGLVGSGGWAPASAVALGSRWGAADDVARILAPLVVRRALAAGVLAVCGMFLFREEVGSGFVALVFGAAATAVGQVSLQFIVSIAQGAGMAGRANLLNAAVSLAYAAPIAALAVCQFLLGASVSVATVASVFGLSWVVPLFVGCSLLWSAYRAGAVSGRRAGRLVERMRVYSRRSFIGSLTLYERLRADQLVGLLVLTTAGLGQYVMAMSFTGLLKALGQALGVSMLSVTARSSGLTRLGRRLVRSCGLILAVAVAVGVLLWPAFHWVLPEEFLPALPVAALLVVAAGVSATRRVCVEYTKGMDRPVWSTGAELVFAAVLVALVLVGAPDVSPFELALATMVGCVAALAVAVVAVRRVHVSARRERA